MLSSVYGKFKKEPTKKNIIYFCDNPIRDKGKVYAFLSPYYSSNFVIHKKLYHNVLQYYYAIKFESWKDINLQIMLAHSAQEIYLIAKRNSLKFKSQYTCWKTKRIEVMKVALKEKFNQNPVLMNKLKFTGSSILIYVNSRSKFWASSLMNSQNMMGSLLTQLRDESKKNYDPVNLIVGGNMAKKMLKKNTSTNLKTISNTFISQNTSLKEIENQLKQTITFTKDYNPQLQNSKIQYKDLYIKKNHLNQLTRNSLELPENSFLEKYSKTAIEKVDIPKGYCAPIITRTKQLSLYIPFSNNREKLEIINPDLIEEANKNKIETTKNPILIIEESKIEIENGLKVREIKKKKKMKDIARRIKAKISWKRIKSSLKIKPIQDEEANKLISEKTEEEKFAIANALNETSPFMFLANSDRQILLEEGYLYECKKQVLLCESDSLLNKCCFIVLKGEIHVLNNEDKFLERLDKNTYFGVEGPLLDIRSTKFLNIMDSTVFVIRQKTLYKILKPNSMFAINIARNLINKQSILSPIIQLKRYFRQTVLQDSINLQTMMEIYKKIDSCLHPKCNSRELDIDSWLYSIRRLPDNLTSSFSILITFSKIPDLLNLASLKPIKSQFRTRSIFELMPGKILIVLKEMETDLMDFLANLCIHLVEASKLASKINSPLHFKELQCCKSEEETNQILDNMGFSEFEIKGLRKIWPKNLATKLVQIIMHRNNFLIQVRNPTSNIKQDPIEKWTIKLWKATSKLLNLDKNILCCDIPDNEFAVDILQGSRRGFLGVISPYIFKNKEKIFEWAEKAKPKIITKQFLCEEDKLMAYSYHYFQQHPEEEQKRILLEEGCGIIRVDDHDFTGIAFVIVNAKKLKQEWVDPKIKLKFNTKYHIIINIGYTFGAQSSDIMRAIVVVFGRKMKTLNIVGKAGGFVGHKGEILVATKIISEENMEVVVNNLGDFESKKLAKETCTSVHLGPMLTVGGTILQNTILLNFYEKLFGCIGLEMEALYYAKELKKFRKLGWVREGLISLFAYYISDLPKDPNSNLSQEEGNISFDEGVPSMNAIYRHFIARLFCTVS